MLTQTQGPTIRRSAVRLRRTEHSQEEHSQEEHCH